MTSSAGAARARNIRTLRRALVLSVLAGFLLSLAFVVATFVFGDTKQNMGALVGMGFSLIVTLPTLVIGVWGIERGFAALASLVLGTWLLKMALLIVAILLVRPLPWLSLPWAGMGLLLGALIPTVVEVVLLLRVRPKLEV